jgi:hypothetical protein
MKRYLVLGAVAADAVFTLSLGLDAWQGWIVFIAIAATVILAVFAWIEHTDLKVERKHSAELLAWIDMHGLGTPFAPYDGDQVDRGRP